MISHQHECIFVHIPKCGGTSIEDIIWPMPRNESDLWKGLINEYENKYQTGGLQHLKGCQILQEVGKNVYEKYYKFSFIRNPWDKAVSQYAYMQNRKDLMDFIGMKNGASFKKYLELIQKKKHVQWEEQYKFILDDNGELMVDFLGRFERFNEDVLKVLKKFGIDVNEIPHSMKSKRKSYDSYYDSESMEMLQSIYKVDIGTFGYTFSK